MAIRRFRGHRCRIRALKQKTAQADDQQPVHLNWLRSWVLGGEATRANISCALPGLALGDKHLLNVGPRRTAFLSRVLESARNCDSAGSRRSTRRWRNKLKTHPTSAIVSSLGTREK
jgi:hypothetical protein